MRPLLALLLLATPALAQFAPTGRHYGPEACPTEAIFVWTGVDANGPWSWPLPNEWQPNVWHVAELPATVPVTATHVDVSWIAIGSNRTGDTTSAYLYLRKPGAVGRASHPRDQWMALAYGGWRSCGGIAKVPVANHQIEWGYWIAQGQSYPGVTYGLMMYCEGYDVP